MTNILLLDCKTPVLVGLEINVFLIKRAAEKKTEKKKAGKDITKDRIIDD